MMIMFPGGYENAKPGTVPDLKAIEKMRKYNEQLQKAGVLLALDGLHPPSMGARVTFKGGKSKVTDGPFSESKEVVGGYWMIQVKSREEALEWASRIPGSHTEMVEVRQVMEITDFPADVQKKFEQFEEQIAEGGYKLGQQEWDSRPGCPPAIARRNTGKDRRRTTITRGASAFTPF